MVKDKLLVVLVVLVMILCNIIVEIYNRWGELTPYLISIIIEKWKNNIINENYDR